MNRTKSGGHQCRAEACPMPKVPILRNSNKAREMLKPSYHLEVVNQTCAKPTNKTSRCGNRIQILAPSISEAAIKASRMTKCRT